MLHDGEWISAKTTTESYSYFNQVRMQIRVTRTTYSDATEWRLSLCDRCLADQALKSLRTPFLAISALWVGLTLVGLLPITEPKNGMVWRVSLGAMLALMWIGLLGMFGYMALGLRRHRANPDEAGAFWHQAKPDAAVALTDYAAAFNKAQGRALFSLEAWRELVAESNRAHVNDDPSDPRAVGTAVSKVSRE
jgi:hypothetical protein